MFTQTTTDDAKAPPEYAYCGLDDTIVDATVETDRSAAASAGESDVSSGAPPEVGPDSAAGFKGEGALLNERFELIKCVGSGGMSTVYKALDRGKLHIDDCDPYVAVKILNRRFGASPDWLNALRQEARKCQHLVHPNIIRVYDFYRDGAVVYITMEYLQGEPLARRMRCEDFAGMPAALARQIIHAMGAALAFAHACGIVHCDFKPANVFLTTAGKAKLIDFGIARLVEEVEGIGGDGGLDLSAVGAVTPAYASPDVLEWHEPDPRDDVYALACTAYELLTGVHPFGHRPATEARDAGLEVAHRAGISRRQWQALQRALAFDRAKRTPSVTRFLEELDGGGRPLAGISIAAGIAFIVAAGAVYLYQHGSRKPEVPPPRTEIAPEGSPPAKQVAEPVSFSSSAAGEVAPATSAPPVVPSAETTLAPARQPAPDASVQAAPAPAAMESPGSEDMQMAGLLACAPPECTHKSLIREITERTEELLVTAEHRMAAKLLTTPKGHSALEDYREVLRLVPGHEGALAGIERIKSKYKNWAQAAIRQGDWEQAEADLNKALALTPEDSVLEEALRRVQEARRPAMEKTTRIAPKATQANAQASAPNVAAPATAIGRVEHEILDARYPPKVAIRVRITGPVQRVVVFIGTADGFVPHVLLDDGTRGDPTRSDNEYRTELTLVGGERAIPYYVAAYLREGAVMYSPERPRAAPYLINTGLFKEFFDRIQTPASVE